MLSVSLMNDVILSVAFFIAVLDVIIKSDGILSLGFLLAY